MRRHSAGPFAPEPLLTFRQGIDGTGLSSVIMVSFLAGSQSFFNAFSIGNAIGSLPCGAQPPASCFLWLYKADRNG